MQTPKRPGARRVLAVSVVGFLPVLASLAAPGFADPPAPSLGQIQLVAGTGQQGPIQPNKSPGATIAPQTATTVEIQQPSSIAISPSGDVYIADNGADRYVPATGDIQQIAGGGGLPLASPTPQPATSVEGGGNLTVDPSGNVYMQGAMAGGGENLIEDKAGQVQALTGYGTTPPSVTPEPAASMPAFSYEPTVTADSAGNVYMLVPGTPGSGQPTVACAPNQVTCVWYPTNSELVEYSPATGDVQVVAGGGALAPTPSPQTATEVDLGGSRGSGLATGPSGAVYLTEDGAVDEYVPSTGQVQVVAGGGSSAPSMAPQSASSVAIPTGPIAVDSAGDIYVSGVVNRANVSLFEGVLEFDANNGEVWSLANDNAGNPSHPTTSSQSVSAVTLLPISLAVDAAGRLYVGDAYYRLDLLTLPPEPPTDPHAVAQSEAVTVSFKPSALDGGAPITGYSVTDGSGHICSPASMTPDAGGELSCTVTGLTDGTKYTFSVTSINGVGSSAGSGEVSATPVGRPEAPSSLRARVGDSQATISFVPGSDGGLRVLSYAVSDGSGHSCSPASTTPDGDGRLECTVSGLVNGTTYEFTATATNSFGASNPSIAVPVTPPGASASVNVRISQTAISATVSPALGQPAPGGMTPTGSVTFSVNGAAVGTASVSNGEATLAYHSTGSETVQAAYSGDGNFTPATGLLTTTNPTIHATLTSSSAKSAYDWYRAPVTLTYLCAPGTGAVTCPSPVTLTSNGANQSVTRSITASDGGTASVTVGGINIDLTAPKVSVVGARSGATYDAPGPTPTCKVTPSISGVSGACRVVVSRTATSTSWTMSVTSRSGITTVAKGADHLLRVWVSGVPYRSGEFDLVGGRTYTLVAYAPGRTAPVFLWRKPVGGAALGPSIKMRASTGGRWTARLFLNSSYLWKIAVAFGRTEVLVTVRLS